MSNYWQRRFRAVEEMNNKRAKETIQSVTPAFDKALAQIEKEINAWYARFAKNNEISLQEAKKLLNTRELKEFRWSVEEYIKYGRQNAIGQQWMKQLENASARFHVSRLEALKIHTQNAAEQAFGNELDQLDQMAAKMYMDDYYHTAYEIQRGLGIGFDVAQIDKRKLDNLLSKPWTADKMTFSDRIWKSKTQLIDSLHTELTQMCVLGKSPDQAINNIAKQMNVSKNQAGRLVMTESAYFASAAQKDCFNDLDVEKFEIVATLDSHTSEICQKMDGKVFDMKDFQAGVTAPPFHVWCRSCTCPWFEDDDDGKRIARGADGKTYYVPSNMTYNEWKEEFVQDATARTATVSDKQQFSRYAGVLKENAPKTLEEFVKIKYNDSDKWEQLKYQYRTVNRYQVQGNVSTDKILELDNAAFSTKRNGFDYSDLHGKSRERIKKLSTTGNAAVMELDGEIYFSHSMIGSTGSLEFDSYVGEYPLVGLSKNRTYTTLDLGDGIPREYDTEAKFLEHITSLKKNGAEEFVVTILSEKHICESCQNVVKQFKEKYPNATVNIVSGNPDYGKSNEHGEKGLKNWKYRKR